MSKQRPFRRAAGRMWTVAVVAAGTLAGAGSAVAAMTVERGDVLRVLITEMPNMSRDNVKVGADGEIMLPLVGGVPVAGSELDEVRHKIEAALVDNELVRAPTVLVEVASYRPVYVGGNVKSPGTVAFEPGMSVRQAIILAGGVDRSKDAERLSVPELVELKSDWYETTYEAFTVESAIARLEAELARAQAPDFDRIDTPFIDKNESDDMVALDGALFEDRMAQWSEHQTHLKDVLALFDLELSVLDKQATLQENERSLQADQVEKAQQLYDKGLIPLPRLQDMQRESSRLSRDLLENQAYTARARQNKETQRYARDVANAEWQIDVRKELRDYLLRRKQLRLKIDVLSAALLDAGVTLRETGSRAEERDPLVTIYRRDAQARQQEIAASMTVEVQPGDILEISLAKGLPEG